MYIYQTAFDLDLTGKNPDNLVKDEPHKLSTKKYRALIPLNGLFYESSVIIRDKSRVLVRGVDYICVSLHEELSLRTGLAVYSGILITDKTVGQRPTITYQVVGGPYTNDNHAISKLYDSVVNDTRPVHWENISNKPAEYPPGDHFHPLRDVVGWGPVIHQLERLNHTVGYGRVDLTKKIVSGLVGTFGCRELEYNLPNSRITQYDAVLHTLSERKLLSELSVNTKQCMWSPGRMAHFDIDTSRYPKGHTFYWQIYKAYGEEIHVPIETHGIVEGNGGTVRVELYVPGNHVHEREALYVGVTDKPFKDQFDAVSYRILFDIPLYGHSSFGMMANINHNESDETHVPGLYNKDKLSRLRYLLDHLSPVKYLTM